MVNHYHCSAFQATRLTGYTATAGSQPGQALQHYINKTETYYQKVASTQPLPKAEAAPEALEYAASLWLCCCMAALFTVNARLVHAC